MNISIPKIFVLVIGVLLFSSCSHNPKTVTSTDYESVKPRWIAVLPVKNSSGKKITVPAAGVLRVIFDKQKPVEALREYVAYQVHNRGYKVQDLATTDTLLEDIKKFETDKIPALAKALKADAILVPEIRGWNSDLLEMNNRLYLDLNFRLYSGNTGKLIWEAQNPSKIIWVNAPSAGLNYLVHLQKMADQTFSSLPKGDR